MSIDEVLGDLIDTTAELYLDDINVNGLSEESFLESLELVLERLSNKGEARSTSACS
jgi:hypothetical protein